MQSESGTLQILKSGRHDGACLLLRWRFHLHAVAVAARNYHPPLAVDRDDSPLIILEIVKCFRQLVLSMAG